MYKVIELEVNPEISGDTGVFEVAWVEYPAIEQELMYFGQQRFYKAPENVSAKACRAIKENEERGNPAATQTGKIRAQQLCNRDEISLETVKRMKSYLERAATYYTGNYDDNGTISYDLWGGKPALEWVDSILKKEEEKMGVQDFVKPGPTESKDEFISRCIAYVRNEGKTEDQAAGQCYGQWENRQFEVGVPHYTKDGKLYEGPTHKDADGRLMTGSVHTEDSEYLYHEGEFSGTRVGFDWEVLKTPAGLRLFKNEMSRGSLPVLFIQGLPTRELIDFTNEYRIPVSAINMYSTRNEKIRLIKDMGLPRHYDLDFNVRSELGTIAIRFDYDVSGLPVYDNYPSSGDTDSMLVEPELPPVLFEGDCGCGNGNFEGLEDACWEGYIAIGTKILNGREVPNCVPKDSAESFSVEDYTEEEIELVKALKFLAETDHEKFEAVVGAMRGSTEQEIYRRNHTTPTVYFKYERILTGSPDRDFCDSIEDRYFRRLEIDLLRDTNIEFGHKGQPYSKWLYKGGPNCVHAWHKYLFQGSNKSDQGMADGKAGIPPKSMPNNGYFSPETKRKSEVAYIISQQNMSSVSYMKDISCAFGDVCTPKLDSKEQVFAAKTEERMIYTPLMIPDILIPRMDEVTNEKYYVKFRPETIQIIRDKFMAELRNRKTNYEHSDKKFEDIVMVETWIVKGEKDKAYELGFTQEQVPFGSWMAAYKVLETPEGNLVWNKYIKPGVVRGASVEGNFLLNFSQQRGDDYLLEQVINIINQITD